MIPMSAMPRLSIPPLIALLSVTACHTQTPAPDTAPTAAPAGTTTSPIFRYVQLGPGRVVLGERVPVAVLEALGARAGDTIVPLPRGSFDGAERITLYLSAASVLRGAIFDYAHGADFDAMVRDYATTLGGPSRTEDRRRGEEPAEVATWVDTRTTLVLRRDPNRSAWTVRGELWDRASPRAEADAHDGGRAVAVRWTVPAEVTGVARGLAYRLRHQLRPDTLTTTLALTNRGSTPVQLKFGACSLELFLYSADDSLGRGEPVFRSYRQRAANLPPGVVAGCQGYLAVHDVAPGATLEAPEFVTRSLPDKPPLTTLAPGTYAAVLRLGLLEDRAGRMVQDTLVIPAGTFRAFP
jgi:hypothetical protein